MTFAAVRLRRTCWLFYPHFYGFYGISRGFMRNALMLIALALSLTACITNPLPYDRVKFEGRALADLGIAPGTIRHHGSCQYGRFQPGYTDTYFYPCIYIDTPTWVALLDFDVQQKKYIEVVHLPIDASVEVALQDFSLGDQLQIVAEKRRLLIDFGGAGNGVDAQTVFDYLRGAGMSTGTSVGHIGARIHDPQPAPVVIPIYLPAK